MASREQLSDMLEAGLDKLGLKLEEKQVEALVRYLLMLDKWNSAYNLSGIKDVGQMVAYHLLDSLAVLPYIDGDVILDIGTGAGLPGIPLAICSPDKQFLLLDSNGKKTRFLFQVKTELGLENVTVFHQRVENFQSRQQIDIVLCRAFAALDRFVKQASPILEAGSRMLAMKGQYPDAEIADLPPGFEARQVFALAVPGVDGPRHLVEIGPVA